MYVLYNVVQMDQYTARNSRVEMYAVTIKISMTEYHHLINCKGSWFIVTLQSIGGNEYGKPGHSYISLLL